MGDELEIREAQLQKLREILVEKDKEHQASINRYKDKIKGYEV